jgi:hypothetical protein
MKLHKEDNRDKVLLALGGGLVLSGFLPTPADAWNFHRQRILRQKLVNGEITAKQYWQKIALNHYGYTTMYWLSLVGVSFALGKNFEQKRNILIVAALGGAVAGVLTNNIKKDEEFFNTHKIVAIKKPDPEPIKEDEPED